MNKQRLTPTFSEWPSTCFYPMNKKRKVGENWFTLSKDERNALMSEHARSGMAFAGKATQLISVGLGMDDWEWGVTLWAANPEYLKDIVYKMRFDEASARYAEFGPVPYQLRFDGRGDARSLPGRRLNPRLISLLGLCHDDWAGVADEFAQAANPLAGDFWWAWATSRFCAC